MTTWEKAAIGFCVGYIGMTILLNLFGPRSR